MGSGMLPVLPRCACLSFVSGIQADPPPWGLMHCPLSSKVVRALLEADHEVIVVSAVSATVFESNVGGRHPRLSMRSAIFDYGAHQLSPIQVDPK